MTDATTVNLDADVDAALFKCFSKDASTSFFLFAGAGSGKTRSLVELLSQIRMQFGDQMKIHGQQIGVITYTNAACDEITRRLEFDPMIKAVTIHSFIWTLISGFNEDIGLWVTNDLRIQISELEQEIRKGRPGTKIAAERQRSLESKNARLTALAGIKKFIYSPTSDNRTRDSLNHSEVIKIGADFIKNKPIMQSLLIHKFPILLIDESQDTNKLLIEAFFHVQQTHRQNFILGLFGDTMQRIYSDGKVDLGNPLPSDWATPAKRMNFRCPKRIVRLINQIRSSVDRQAQQPRPDAPEGVVRLFIASFMANKSLVELDVRKKMALGSGDNLWEQPNEVKTLILEHHMAAKRLNFLAMFTALSEVSNFEPGLRDGSLPLLRFFSDMALPLVKYKLAKDDFGSARIIRKWSPLMSADAFLKSGSDQVEQLKLINTAVDDLVALFTNNSSPQFLAVLKCVKKHNLFQIPEILIPFVSDGDEVLEEDLDEEAPSLVFNAIREFLGTPFLQIEAYQKYISGEASYATHQGVKGLEFPRVMVIMDDEEARGFLFTYEKLFGAKEKSKQDIENENSGKETGVDRTRRLFYVTCSRAKEGLAIVAYSTDPNRVKAHVLAQGWFSASEVELV